MWPFQNKNNNTPPQTEQHQPKAKRTRSLTPNRLIQEINNSRTFGDSIVGLSSERLSSMGGAYGNWNVNQVLRQTLPSLRSACRHLSVQNPFAKRYVSLSSNLVVGADGITVRPRPLSHDGTTNQELSERLEKAFYDWSENASEFSFDGYLSIDLFQQLVERTRAIDGECFIRIHRDRQSVKFSIIDSSRIPSTKNELLQHGHFISNGIEYDQDGRVLAYHIADVHPLNYSLQVASCKRLPADEIIHYFIPEFPNQQRGIPDLCPSLKALQDYNSYIEATLIGKRISSSAMAFIKNDSDSGLLDEDEEQQREYFEYLEPGSIKELSRGQSIETINPTAGVDKISEFSEIIMQTIVTGLSTTKQNLTGDTANASFSAAKMSDRIQRDGMKTRSNLMISKVLKTVYQEWLKVFMINTLKNLSFSDFDNIKNAEYILPKQISLDPNKDAQYEKILVDMGVKSKSQVIRDLGQDPIRVFEEIDSEKEKINKEENITVQGSTTDGIEKEESNEGDKPIE
ncbi:phage portal protein [Pectobacterium odoriferum]|uniref:phage portal protein n=1 Tax=Pectobacterium odoriferum TaxID=78398 RepID=UPI000CD0EF9C|nr:phage portal protein [Pectobacterium odoriferum]POE24974.1 phage portal protein [Pectobacterium odoriferum]